MQGRITPPPAPGVKAVLVLAQLNPGAGVEPVFTGRSRFSGDVKPKHWLYLQTSPERAPILQRCERPKYGRNLTPK